jgi:hypothetical protein
MNEFGRCLWIIPIVGIGLSDGDLKEIESKTDMAKRFP